jgi:hypothetical protein
MTIHKRNIHRVDICAVSVRHVFLGITAMTP